ncbi:MAG: hypothetical protein ACTSQ8_19160 [Candidatus Helarchaeota archaeon]
MKGRDILLGVVIFGLFIWALSGTGFDFSKFVSQSSTTQQGDQDTITEDTESQTQVTDDRKIDIYAISSVNYKPTVTDALNETRETLSATFYVWQPDAVEPTTVTLTTGSGSQAVPPNKLITWAAGSDGTYYWEKDTTAIGWQDKPEDIKLHSVAGANDVSVKIYYNYADQTSGAANQSVGTGGALTYQIQIDNTGEYTAVRRPHLCVDYNTSVTREADVGGLTEIEAIPTRLISGLDQCWDTGISYYTDSDAVLTYDATLRAVSGVNPNVNNSHIYWYVIDMDKYYKDGKMYFTNPVDMSNMGSTTNWSGDHYQG